MSFDRDSTAAEVAAGHDLAGRNVIVTGGTSGLGEETARVLASIGASVTITSRDPQRGEATAARLRTESGNDSVESAELDLGSLASVAAFIERYLVSGRPLHVLVNNAGIMAVPLAYTIDGFESQFATNHLGHFALTLGLRPALFAGAGARVVSLTSRAHRRGDFDFDDPNYRYTPYDPWEAYGRSKTAVSLFAVGFTNHHRTDGITANALEPGAVYTGLAAHLDRANLLALGWIESDGRLVPPPTWKSIPQGAATTVWAAVASELDGVSGEYLDDCAIAQPWNHKGELPHGYHMPYATDPDHAERLWELSVELIQSFPGTIA
ncbi:MAG: SDR family NAD(P)-dependent oxidoreductase [Acidimicrobiales bacterium]